MIRLDLPHFVLLTVTLASFNYIFLFLGPPHSISDKLVEEIFGKIVFTQL